MNMEVEGVFKLRQCWAYLVGRLQRKCSWIWERDSGQVASSLKSFVAGEFNESRGPEHIPAMSFFMLDFAA